MAEQNEQIKNYIMQARMQGLSDQQIRANLTAVGWHNDQINQGFSTVVGGSLLSRPGFRISATALIVLIFAGAAYFAYARYSPQAVMGGFLKSLGKQQTLTGSRHTVFNFEITDSELGKLGLDLSGDATVTGPKVNQTAMDVKVGLNAQVQPPGQPGQVNFNANNIEIREDSGKLYLNVSQIPILSDSAKNYDGWVKLDLGQLPADQQTQIEQGLNSTPGESEQFQQALQSLQQNNVISTSLAGIQKVGGVYAYHYHVTINRNSLIQLLTTQLGQFYAQKGELATLDALKLYLNNINFRQSDIWLGITDKQIHKLEFQAIAPSLSGMVARQQGVANAQLIKGSLNVTLSYELSPAAPVQIVAPAKALDLSSSGGLQLSPLP